MARFVDLQPMDTVRDASGEIVIITGMSTDRIGRVTKATGFNVKKEAFVDLSPLGLKYVSLLDATDPEGNTTYFK